MKFNPIVLLPMVIAVCAFIGATTPNAIAIQTSKDESPYLPLKKCWEYPLENRGAATVVAANGTIYFAEAEGRIRSLNARTGSVNWVSDLGGRVSAILPVNANGIVAVTASSSVGKRSSLRLLNADSGLVKFAAAIDGGERVYLFSSGGRLIAIDSLGVVSAFSAETGETAWQFKLSGALTAAPAISPEILVAATDGNKISVISIDGGKLLAAIPTARRITALAVSGNQMILAGDDRGRVTNYRDSRGSVWWQFKSGARIGAISETPRGILIGSYDNFLYLLSKYSGDVKWKRRLEGRITTAPAVFGDQILAASATGDNAQLIDLENGRSVDQILFGEDRNMLSQAVVTGSNFAIFQFADAVAGYSQEICPAK